MEKNGGCIVVLVPSTQQLAAPINEMTLSNEYPCSKVQLDLYVDGGYGRKATDRRPVSDEVTMCVGGCVSFLPRTQMSRTCY